MVLGRQGYCEIFIGDTWYPVFCFKSADLTLEEEVIEKTSVNSGRMREYTTGMGTGTLRVSGVTTLSNTTDAVSILWLMQNRAVQHQVRMHLINTSGVERTITFNAIIERQNINNEISLWSQSSVDMRISGDIDVGEPLSPPEPGVYQVFSDYWETTEGLSVVSGSSVEHNYTLNDKTVIAVYREGIEYDLIPSGVPVNRQCRHSGSTVIFDPAMPFNSGERVFIIFTE